jgi:hypothetical protein
MPEASTTTWMFQYNPNDCTLNDTLGDKLTEPWTIYWGRSVVRLGERTIVGMRTGEAHYSGRNLAPAIASLARAWNIG